MIAARTRQGWYIRGSKYSLTSRGVRRLLLLVRLLLRREVLGPCSGHDLKAQIKVDQQGFEVLVDLLVTLELGLAGGDLFIEVDSTHHRFFQIFSIDGDGQIGIARLKALDVRQCAVA